MQNFECICGKPAQFECDRCRNAYYCCQTCQSKAWVDGHSSECHMSAGAATAVAKSSFYSLDASTAATLRDSGLGASATGVWDVGGESNGGGGGDEQSPRSSTPAEPVTAADIRRDLGQLGEPHLFLWDFDGTLTDPTVSDSKAVLVRRFAEGARVITLRRWFEFTMENGTRLREMMDQLDTITQLLLDEELIAERKLALGKQREKLLGERLALRAAFDVQVPLLPERIFASAPLFSTIVGVLNETEGHKYGIITNAHDAQAEELDRLLVQNRFFSFLVGGAEASEWRIVAGRAKIEFFLRELHLDGVFDTTGRKGTLETGMQTPTLLQSAPTGGKVDHVRRAIRATQFALGAEEVEALRNVVVFEDNASNLKNLLSAFPSASERKFVLINLMDGFVFRTWRNLFAQIADTKQPRVRRATRTAATGVFGSRTRSRFQFNVGENDDAGVANVQNNLFASI